MKIETSIDNKTKQVHLINPTANEFSMCGKADEGDGIGFEGHARNTLPKKVTCPHCLKIIIACRKAKI